MIGFAFDYTSIASLLAFGPTCALADELGIAIEWLPMPGVGREGPARPTGREDSVAERHGRVRAEYYAMDAARYARWQGIEINCDPAGVDSALACAGGLWAERHGVAHGYHRFVFAEFWEQCLDIEDPATLAAVLDELGAPGFSGQDFEVTLAAHRTSVEGRGVHTLPAYLVEEQMFVGRAHLPMIRWILQGRHGPGPL